MFIGAHRYVCSFWMEQGRCFPIFNLHVSWFWDDCRPWFVFGNSMERFLLETFKGHRGNLTSGGRGNCLGEVSDQDWLWFKLLNSDLSSMSFCNNCSIGFHEIHGEVRSEPPPTDWEICITCCYRKLVHVYTCFYLLCLLCSLPTI